MEITRTYANRIHVVKHTKLPEFVDIREKSVKGVTLSEQKVDMKNIILTEKSKKSG